MASEISIEADSPLPPSIDDHYIFVLLVAAETVIAHLHNLLMLAVSEHLQAMTHKFKELSANEFSVMFR
jgi:hypothetical protein